MTRTEAQQRMNDVLNGRRIEELSDAELTEYYTLRDTYTRADRAISHRMELIAQGHYVPKLACE